MTAKYRICARSKTRKRATWCTRRQRPSDAIAVAVTCEPNLPIYVSEEVLENVLG